MYLVRRTDNEQAKLIKLGIRPNIEDYLPTDSIQEPLSKLQLTLSHDVSSRILQSLGTGMCMFPLWCLGVVVRYEILFPVRVLILALGWIVFLSSYIPVHVLLKGHDLLREKLEYHGPRPCARPIFQHAFELGSTVCAIAIKYNKIFVDAFWNSRKQSFTTNLLQLMTSWAVVCDVWYLKPQNMKPGETPIEFADLKVRNIISVRAGHKMVPWDGYLKYSRPRPKHRKRK
ncbi:hypothetical protein Ccrd_017658 [Cynara cardunculus var. scolymus]|uniref:Uncharacterized protein n=1 Tax=Cynara cardunculus var. scolymus TaxID=59895 RepID=A0A118K2A2_CYNCS|nr:hypothetical protein Ccrd_017658 [Cynara cardunculus var. scolymus]